MEKMRFMWIRGPKLGFWEIGGRKPELSRSFQVLVEGHLEFKECICTLAATNDCHGVAEKVCLGHPRGLKPTDSVGLNVRAEARTLRSVDISSVHIIRDSPTCRRNLHSHLSATIGSTRVAFRPGMKIATKATMNRNTGTEIKAIGS